MSCMFNKDKDTITYTYNDYMTFHPITKTDHNQYGSLPKRTTLKRTITKTDYHYQKKICIARIFI